MCGRINLLTSETCARCGRDQREVLTKFNEKAFSDRRSEAARQRRAPQENKREKRKASAARAGRAAVIAVLMLLLALLGFLLGRMSAKEDSARQPSATAAPAYEDRMGGSNA